MLVLNVSKQGSVCECSIACCHEVHNGERVKTWLELSSANNNGECKTREQNTKRVPSLFCILLLHPPEKNHNGALCETW